MIMENRTAHTQMVAGQLRPWEVLDPVVLDVLAALPRDRFVPDPMQSLAFADARIPLAHGQYMMEPRIEGRLLQALTISGHDRVLEIGTGSGFLTACLARLAHHVTSIDLFEDFVADAEKMLASLDIGNCSLSVQDVFAMTPEQPFDVIAVTGSVPQLDPRFQDWLAPQGRLFIVVGEPPVMEAMLIRRASPDHWSLESLFETVLPPLINAPLPEHFVF